IKVCRASMPPAEAPMPTTGMLSLFFSSSASPLPLDFIPVIARHSPFGFFRHRARPIFVAHDHPPDHLGVFLILACPALELPGQAVPVAATLLVRHAMGEGGALLMGPHEAFQHGVDLAAQSGKDGLCRESMADMAAIT